MNTLGIPSLKRTIGAMLVAAGLMVFGGCVKDNTLVVEGFNVPEKAAIEAPMIVHSMQRAGFTDEQILAHGPALRNYLATQGGARVRKEQLTLAMFMIRRDSLFGTAVNRGAFHFPLDDAQAQTAAPPSDADAQSVADAD